MNYAIVFRLLGYVLMIEGALLLLPAAASLVYGEWMVLGVFLLTAAVSAGIGYALHTNQQHHEHERVGRTLGSHDVLDVIAAVECQHDVAHEEPCLLYTSPSPRD